MKPSQRLYVTASLSQGAMVKLTPEQAHYLGVVLRQQPGSQVLLFNGRDGEWAATLEIISKKGSEAICVEQTRLQNPTPSLWLYFAPVKGDRTDYIVEKATELGVVSIVPVITERTIVRKVNIERLRARCIEAAEQCGRLSVPELNEQIALSELYTAPKTNKIILFADEARSGDTIANTLAKGFEQFEQVGLLIGPEGGFTTGERAKLGGCAHVIPVGLGPRILRADTATFAGLTLIQSVWGDWQ